MLLRPCHPRRALRPAARRRLLQLEPLEARELLAILTVGASGQFSTIQAAVDRALPFDRIQVAAGIYSESIDLSRMGSALGRSPGSLTITGTGETTIVGSPQGPAFHNSAPLSGDLTLEQLAIAPGGGTDGVRLSNVAGDLTIRDNLFRDLGDDALDLRNYSGSLRVEGNEFRATGDQDADHGLRLEQVAGQVLVVDNVFRNLAGVAIGLSNSGPVEALILVDDNEITGDENFVATTDVGFRAQFSGAAIADVSLVRNDFRHLSRSAVEVTASDETRLQARWQLNRVSNTHAAAAFRLTLEDQVSAAASVLDNSLTDLAGGGIHMGLTGAASLDAVIRNNLFLTVGNSVDDQSLVLTSAADSTGRIRAAIENNDFASLTGDAVRVAAAGAAQWTLGLTDNVLSEFNPDVRTAALTIAQGAATTGSLQLRLQENTVLGDGVDAYVLQQQGAGAFELEGNGANPTAVIASNNDGGPIQVSGNVTLRSPGSFDAHLPLLVGDFVWRDTDTDGLQDEGEPGAPYVVLSLSGGSAGASFSRRTLSDKLGGYRFSAVVPGTYTLEVGEPTGYSLAPANVGPNDQLDSDFVPASRTVQISLAAGTLDLSRDAGLWVNWQNPDNRLDVDGDSFVSPIDALLIINDLNSNGSRQLPVPAGGTPPYLDVDGDGFVAPVDVLLVVNFLNLNSTVFTGASAPQGEGEASVEGTALLWNWLEAQDRRRRRGS